MTKDVEQEIDNLPLVAIVGRVNVGKSTFFNKLIEKNKALTSVIPGTTRTSNEGLVLWRGKYFKLIDTGGLTFDDDVPLENDILIQSKRAMKEADIIIFMIDAKTDIMPQEKELAKYMRRIITKPVLLVANKVDNKRIEMQLLSGESYKLGLGEPFKVSSTSGRSVGDFLDHLFGLLQKTKKRPKKHKEYESIKVSLIGKPNVGKSSIFNKLIGEDKVIVNEMAHTTREPFDTNVVYKYKVGNKTVAQNITFVDTAGIRRKTKVSGQLERVGIQKSIKTVEESDIILFVIDANEIIASQDMQLGGLIEKRAKSVILLVNKWDLSEDNSDTKRHLVEKMVYSHFPHLDFAPIVFISGKDGYGIHKIMPLITRAWETRHTIVPVKALEHFLKEVTEKHRPSRGKGTRHPKIVGIRQTASNPPVIELAIKYRTSLHYSYVNFIKNKLRERFDFYASPIIIKLRKMKR
ncbi:MAG: ribosome biogenesis GTPase Der [bacterium]|nr:ribosome biogenesis GTPase Der [bacterium]